MSADEDEQPGARGPFEAFQARSTLPARVVRAGSRPQIFGLDVHQDLARHYSFAEVVLLTFTGQPPTHSQGRAFEVALIFLSPASVGEAPGHAAVLARLFGADSRGLAAAAALTLCEQAHAIVSERRDDSSRLEEPSSLASSPSVDREAVRRLSQHLDETGLKGADLIGNASTLEDALVRVLAACGLEQPAQKEAAIMLARLPAVLAEAWATQPGDFAGYPTRLPDFAYEADRNG